MKIELYPEFDEVFTDNTLKGIFYSLCKVSEISADIAEPLYFVSHNGIWTNDDSVSEQNQAAFTCFGLVSGKYSFEGDIEVYTGHQQAKIIYAILSQDFKDNGESYLSNKLKTEKYIHLINEKYNFNAGELDLEYYLQAFYEFSINKLNYRITGNFDIFTEIVNSWTPSDKSPIVYDITEATGFADIAANQEYLLPASVDINSYKKIGYTVGAEFFGEGSDSYLLLDRDNLRVIILYGHS